MKVWMCIASMVVSMAASAQTVVKVDDPWVRGTVPAQKATGAFMRLTANAPVRLVAANSPVAGVVEIHEMAMEKDVMKMRAVPGLDLTAGKAVELKPGGYHVMLMDLKQQVKAGDTVPLTLVFEDARKQRVTQQVQASVRAMNAPAAHGGMSHGDKGHGAHKH